MTSGSCGQITTSSKLIALVEKKKYFFFHVSLTSAQHIDTMSSTVSMATRAVGQVNRK